MMKMNVSKVLISGVLVANFLSLSADMIYTVTTLQDDGTDIPGSLRWAIDQSNANPPTVSNTINFSIAGTIIPVVDLPAITQPVLIDGYTAPGSSANTNLINDPNNASITIELQGPGAGVDLPVLYGFYFAPGSAGSEVRGLCINSFANIVVPAVNDLVAGAGIFIQDNEITVDGNFIGTDTSGSIALSNAVAITIEFVADTLIGGELPASRNLIFGAISTNYVIENITPFSTTIMGNTIGLNAEGDAAVNNQVNIGLLTLGGPLTFATNVISGHTVANIVCEAGFFGVYGQQSYSNNIIGLNVAGTEAIPCNGNGIVLIDAHEANPCNCTVTDNVISGNTFAVMVGTISYISAVNGLQITNNLIGTDLTGTYSIPNSLDGLCLNGALNTFIGSNVISNNSRNGVRVSKAKNTIVKSNTIDSNGYNGIQLGVPVAVGVPAFGDIIGGALAGEGNTISNNGHHGIQVVSYSQEETIQGNTITDNARDGIHIGPKSSRNWVGGFRDAGNNLLTGELQSQGYVNLGPLGTSNEIANNGGYGISVIRSNENKIQTNIIVDNGGDGITVVDGSDNLIGGKVALYNPAVEIPPVMGNVITGNGGFGVSIVQNKGKAIDNTILSNSIFGNDDAGIEFIS